MAQLKFFILPMLGTGTGDISGRRASHNNGDLGAAAKAPCATAETSHATAAASREATVATAMGALRAVAMASRGRWCLARPRRPCARPQVPSVATATSREATCASRGCDGLAADAAVRMHSKFN